MIKFIIVEDEEKIQNKIKKVLRKISIENDKAIKVEYFCKYGAYLE